MSISQGLVQDVCVCKGILCFASLYKNKTAFVLLHNTEAHYYSCLLQHFTNPSVTPFIIDFLIHSSTFYVSI